MNTDHGKRISLSYIRVIATCCVVLLHTCYMAVSLYGQSISAAERIGSLTVTHLMMSAVPCFVMVTGALLLDPKKEIPIKRLFSRYILRILLALVISSLVYKLFDIVMSRGTEPFSGAALYDCIRKLLTGTGWSHLWYLYMLVALYLLMPVFKAVTKACNDSSLRYIIIIGFIFTCLFPILRKAGGTSAFYIDLATVYPIYLLTGYVISRKILDVSRFSLPMVVMGAAGIAVASYLRYSKELEFFDCLLGYSSPLTFIASAGLFSLLIDKEQLCTLSSKLISAIDPVSLEIYLIHIIFLRLILRYMQIDPFCGNPLTVLCMFTITALSLAVSALLGHAIKLLLSVMRKKFRKTSI